MILEREPQTEFEELGTHFIATFKRNSYELTKPDDVGKNVGKNVGETSVKTTQKTTQKILELLVHNPKISRAELAEEIGITADGIKYHLDRLRKQGVVKRIGPDKGGHWVVEG